MVTKEVPLILLPYRQPKMQLYTIAAYCYKGCRQPSPIKLIKHVYLLEEHVTEFGKILSAFRPNDRFSEPVASLAQAHLELKHELWAYGVEEGSTNREGEEVSYYQAWALLPEPNEYTVGDEVKELSTDKESA